MKAPPWPTITVSCCPVTPAIEVAEVNPPAPPGYPVLQPPGPPPPPPAPHSLTMIELLPGGTTQCWLLPVYAKTAFPVQLTTTLMTFAAPTVLLPFVTMQVIGG